MADRPRPRLRQVDRSQVVPETCLDDLVDPEHPVRAVWDYVCALDLTRLLANIRAVEGVPGRNATDPRLLLALWMWAVSDGVGSARALDRLVREHSAYRWLAGGVTVNYQLLARFRAADPEAFQRFLEAHVAALLQQGLIDLTCVAQDGMRVRASAGSGSFRREPTLAECQHLVRQQLEQLQRQPDEPLDAVARRRRAPQERHLRVRQARLAQAREVAQQLGARQAERVRLHPKEAAQRGTKDKAARASTTDPEARRMKMADGGYRPAYNAQCCTTVGAGIIVGVSVTNQGSDNGQLGPMLDQVAQRYGQQPQQALVDGGFRSTADIEAAHARGIAVYAPLPQEQAALQAGQDPYAPKQGDKAGMRAFRARMGTAEAKALYKQRGQTAEWVNAGMRQRGLGQFLVRGLSKATGVVALQALVHNLWQTRRLLGEQLGSVTWAQILRAEGGAVAG
jgi:transposase